MWNSNGGRLNDFFFIFMNSLVSLAMNFNSTGKFPFNFVISLLIFDGISLGFILFHVSFNGFHDKIKMIANSGNVIATADEICGNQDLRHRIRHSHAELNEQQQIPSWKGCRIKWHPKSERQDPLRCVKLSNNHTIKRKQKTCHIHQLVKEDKFQKFVSKCATLLLRIPVDVSSLRSII